MIVVALAVFVVVGFTLGFVTRPSRHERSIRRYRGEMRE